jgi:hypothetical protein
MANFPPIQFKRSSTLGARPTDSDIRVGELAINLRDRLLFTKDDSDRIIEIGGSSDIDSDISAIKVAIAVLRGEKDSDIAVSRAEHDSDLVMTYHDFRGADSEINKRITNLELFDLHDVKERILTTTTTTPANYGSFSIDDVNSPYFFLQFNTFDNSVKQYGAGEFNNNGIIRIGTGVNTFSGSASTFTDQIFISDTRITDSEFTNEYMVLVPYIFISLSGTTNSVRGMKVLAVADLSYITGANTTSFGTRTLPSNGVRALRPANQWLSQLVSGAGSTATGLQGGDYLSGLNATFNLEVTPASTTTVTTAQTVKQGSILRYDSDSEVWVPSDSLTALESNVNDADSDIAWLRNRITEIILENDSDNFVQNADHDSDVAMTYHDFRSADSDIRRQTSRNLDSEMLARMRADSDIRAEIFNLRFQFDSDNIVSIADYDSDRARLLHDLKADDSDIRVTTARNIDSEIKARKSADSDILYLMERIRLQVDSDNIVKVSDYDSDRSKLRHDYQAADSEIIAFLSGGLAEDLDSEINARKNADSDLRASLFVSTLRDVDVVTTPPKHEQVLAWDSDSELWKPKDAASSIANLKDVDLGTGPTHNQTLIYDSDINFWTPATILQNVYALKSETFVVTANTREIALEEKPIGNIQAARNGVVISASSFTSFDSDNGQSFAIYDPANNDNNTLQGGDRIDLQYVYQLTGIPVTTSIDGGSA